MNSIKSFTVTYDPRGDVLYIVKARSPAARGIEDMQGVVWRYDAGGDLIGATVVDFYDHWHARRDDLALSLAQKFDIPPAQATIVVEHAFDQVAE